MAEEAVPSSCWAVIDTARCLVHEFARVGQLTRARAPEPPHNTKGGGEGATLLMQACDLFTTSKHHQERVEQDDHRKRDRKDTHEPERQGQWL